MKNGTVLTTSSARSAGGTLWRRTTGGSFALVAFGAAMWGTDPVFRQGLALHMPAPAIVAFEQALPTVFLAPFVWRGIRRALAVFNWRDWLALGVLGCGSSALATLLFTVAFTYGRPDTPVLLQQLQPLFAVAGARFLLGERLQRRYGLYLLGGLAGSYLVAFAQPFSLGGVDGWAPALLAVSAALLWGLGTVLGRHLGAKLPFAELTALRLATGLVAALVALAVTGDGSAYSHLGAKAVLALVLLALVPGLLSLLVYYRGLRATPASAATLGELAFPFTALFLDYLAFGTTLSPSQWVGLALLVTTITTMGTLRANGTLTGVEVPGLDRLVNGDHLDPLAITGS
ncbi:MAG: DMT family transporter [Candidatus Limnocylindrales bacterium]